MSSKHTDLIVNDLPLSVEINDSGVIQLFCGDEKVTLGECSPLPQFGYVWMRDEKVSQEMCDGMLLEKVMPLSDEDAVLFRVLPHLLRRIPLAALYVRDIETRTIVAEVDIYNLGERHVERVISGMLINMGTEYFVDSSDVERMRGVLSSRSDISHGS